MSLLIISFYIYLFYSNNFILYMFEISKNIFAKHQKREIEEGKGDDNFTWKTLSK